MDFKLVSDYKPRGDQGTAIHSLVRGLHDQEQHQVLLGVTGSGKTFTMAKVVESLNRPTLVMAHNKTLAAQLYHEFKISFRTTRSNISFPITTTTSPRLTSPPPISTSRKNRPSTTSSTSCGSRRRGRCLSAAMC